MATNNLHKPNLAHKIGIVASSAHLEPIVWWLKAGCRHFRIDLQWGVFNQLTDRYLFDSAKPAFELIKQYHGTILVGLHGTPARLAPSYYPWFRPDFPIVRIMRPEWVEDWKKYVRAFCEWSEQFGETVQVCGAIAESNLPGQWEKERTEQEIKDGVQMQERSADDYVSLYIRPASEILREYGKKVIGGTVTLQGEREWTFQRALKYFRNFKTRNFGTIDHMDFHVYREIGKDTVGDIRRLFKEVKDIKNPVWISELGFNEIHGLDWWTSFLVKIGVKHVTNEERQEIKYKDLFRFLSSTKPEDIDISSMIKRIYLYHAHDTRADQKGDGLLKHNYEPKKAALLVREYLQA